MVGFAPPPKITFPTRLVEAFEALLGVKCPPSIPCFPLDTDFEKGYTKVVRHLVNLKKNLDRQRKVSLQEIAKPRGHRDTLQQCVLSKGEDLSKSLRSLTV